MKLDMKLEMNDENILGISGGSSYVSSYIWSPFSISSPDKSVNIIQRRRNY